MKWTKTAAIQGPNQTTIWPCSFRFPACWSVHWWRIDGLLYSLFAVADVVFLVLYFFCLFCTNIVVVGVVYTIVMVIVYVVACYNATTIANQAFKRRVIHFFVLSFDICKLFCNSLQEGLQLHIHMHIYIYILLVL